MTSSEPSNMGDYPHASSRDRQRPDASSGRVIRLYAPRSHYSPDQRGMLADILRPYWKERELSDDERMREYGPHVAAFEIVEDIEAADLAVLPMYWNHYYELGRIAVAREFVRRAQAQGTPVVTWMGGDFGVRVPVSNVYVFRASGYRSRRAPSEFAVPVFIRDPLPDYADHHLPVRTKRERPLIGFCGQASGNVWRTAGKVFVTAARNCRFHLRMTVDEPQSLFPAALLRAKILGLLERSPLVETSFVAREQYQAGATTVEQRQFARRQFFENIRDTDYTVCVRGSGNFSQRLYEVVALGRIPVFIDTDCMLPYDFNIDWGRYCVWVRAADWRQTAERVAAFHATLSPQEFTDLQRECRRFWESRLSYAGFFAHFLEHFPGMGDKSRAGQRRDALCAGGSGAGGSSVSAEDRCREVAESRVGMSP